MTSIFDLQEVNVAEIFDNLTDIVFSPVIFSVAAAVKQPVVQTLIKEGIIISERCKEAVAETAEIFDNIAAEVNTDLIHEKREQFNYSNVQTYLRDSKSEVARDLINVVSDLNGDVGRMTNGVVDLRLLLPLGLGALAMHQLLDKGIELEEIPWYTLAWYAFDAFIKLNNSDDVELSSSINN